MPKYFQKQLLAWFDLYGRHDLPWQSPRDAYPVWLSEIMLQQTQVATVIPYFNNFMRRFPTVSSLAEASIDELLSLWAGLGYYTRAKNLHRAAQLIVAQGVFPNSLSALMALPGIGRSTAGAILAQAFNQYGVILDGNVRRVLIRFHAVHGDPGTVLLQTKLWDLATHYTPAKRSADYAQAIMDLGAIICTRTKPLCSQCPLAKQCRAFIFNETALLPNKRLGKKNPLKSTLMLVVRNAKQQILLVQRPLSGLWNGLWCLPEITAPEHIDAWLADRSFSLKHQQALKPFRHIFSHFSLDIAIQLIDCTDKAKQPLPADHQWYTLEAALQLGIPAPVTKILRLL